MDHLDHNQEKRKEEPKIFGVSIDEKNHKRYNRREFIKSATLLGTSVALTGCGFLGSNEERAVAESIEKTVDVMLRDETAQAIEQIAMEEGDTTIANTNTPTKQPTTTPTRKLTGTPTEIPTNTEVPFPIGEVTSSHNIFEGPHTNHPIITKTVVGEQVAILGQTFDGSWYKITDSEGTTGWAFSEFIQLLNNQNVAFIYDIPTPVPTLTPIPTPCTCDAHFAPTRRSGGGRPCSCDAVCSCDSVCFCDSFNFWSPP